MLEKENEILKRFDGRLIPACIQKSNAVLNRLNARNIREQQKFASQLRGNVMGRTIASICLMKRVAILRVEGAWTMSSGNCLRLSCFIGNFHCAITTLSVLRYVFVAFSFILISH